MEHEFLSSPFRFSHFRRRIVQERTAMTFLRPFLAVGISRLVAHVQKRIDREKCIVKEKNEKKLI